MVSASRRPTGYSRRRDRTSCTTVGLPCVSRAVETTPAGLFSACTSRGSGSTRRPSSSTAFDSSTSRAGSVTTSPSTVTRPSRTISSAARREATPACARNLPSRMARGYAPRCYSTERRCRRSARVSPRFCAYIASSARDSTSSAVLRSRKSAIPTLAVSGPAGVGTSARIAAPRSSASSVASADAAHGHQHGELVAAEARHDVALAQPVVQHHGHRRQHAVAGAVAEVVVHPLEVVQVEQEQRAAHPVAAAVRDVAVQLLLEAAPVEQAGQRVVVGHVAQARLGRCALDLQLPRVRHVDPGADHVRDIAVRAGQRGGRPLDQPQVAVARAPVELGAHGRLAGAQRSHAVLGDPPLVGRDQVEQRVGRLQLGGGVAQQRLAGAIPPDEPAIGVDDDDQRRRSVEHRIQELAVPGNGDRVPHGGGHRATRIARHTRIACRVRQTFSPHGPEAARRPARLERGAALPRPPGVGVGGARRRLVRRDDEPPARAARAARGRGAVLVAAARATRRWPPTAPRRRSSTPTTAVPSRRS